MSPARSPALTISPALWPCNCSKPSNRSSNRSLKNRRAKLRRCVSAKHRPPPPSCGGAAKAAPTRTPTERLRRSGDALQQVGLAVQRHHETVDALAPQDRIELRSMHRQLADCAIEVHVGDLPRPLIGAH